MMMEIDTLVCRILYGTHSYAFELC